MAWVYRCLALGTVLSLVLPFHFAPWRTFQNDLAAFAAWAPLMLVCAWRSPRGPKSVHALVWLLPVLPWCWPLGGDSFLSDRALASLYLGAGALVFRAGRCEADDLAVRRVMDALWVGWVLGALMNVGVQALQYLNLPTYGLLTAEWTPFGRAPGNVGQPNHLATLQILALLGVLGWWSQGRVRSGVASAGAAVLLVGVALTQSRVGGLAVLMLGSVLAWRPRAWAPGRPAVAAAMLWLALWWMVALHGGEWAGAAGTAGDRLSSASLASRAIHWTNLWLAIAERPWLGWGWGQVGAAQLWALADGLAGQELIEHAHNVFIDLLVWGGVVVGGALCLLVLAVARSLVARVRDPHTSPLGWVAAMSVLVVFLHAQVEYPLDYAYMLLPVAWLCGRALADPRGTEDAGPGTSPLARWATLATTLAMIALGVWVLAEYPRVGNAYLEMRYETAGLLPPKPRQAPDVVLLDAPREYIRLARTPGSDSLSPEELDWARRVAARLPTPAALERYAQFQRHAGNPAAANLTMRRLCKLYGPELCRQMLAELATPAAGGEDSIPLRPY